MFCPVWDTQSERSILSVRHTTLKIVRPIHGRRHPPRVVKLDSATECRRVDLTHESMHLPCSTNPPSSGVREHGERFVWDAQSPAIMATDVLLGLICGGHHEPIVCDTTCSPKPRIHWEVERDLHLQFRPGRVRDGLHAQLQLRFNRPFDWPEQDSLRRELCDINPCLLSLAVLGLPSCLQPLCSCQWPHRPSLRRRRC